MTNKHAQTNKLTADQAKAVEEETNKLRALADKQVLEQAEYLRKYISKDRNCQEVTRNHLLALLTPIDGICPGLKVKSFSISDANVRNQNRVNVTHEFHDALYDYLRSPESLLPKELRGFLDGGIVLEAPKDAAIDLMPLTGKTKVR